MRGLCVSVLGVAVLFCSMLPVPLRADTVVMKSGITLRGDIVGEDEQTITIRSGSSKMTIEKSTVREIRRGADDPLQATPISLFSTPAPSFGELYADKLKTLDTSSGAAEFELAKWCLARGHKPEAIEHFRQASVATAPHPDAVVEAARLGGFIANGRVFTSDQVMAGDTGLSAEDSLRLLDLVSVHANVPLETRQALLSEVSARHELAANWQEVKRVWPRFAAVAEQAARADNRIVMADAIHEIARSYPDGTYPVTRSNPRLDNFGREIVGPLRDGVPLTLGMRALAAPGVLDVALWYTAVSYLNEATKMLDSALTVAATDPERAYLGQLASAEALLAKASILAPDLPTDLRLRLARQKVDILVPLVQQCISRVPSELPWKFVYEHEIGNEALTLDARGKWISRYKSCATACDRAIDGARRILEETRLFPVAFLKEAEDTQNALVVLRSLRQTLDARLKEFVERQRKLQPGSWIDF